MISPRLAGSISSIYPNLVPNHQDTPPRQSGQGNTMPKNGLLSIILLLACVNGRAKILLP